MFQTADDVQWNASRAQPCYQAEPSAGHFRSGTAKLSTRDPALSPENVASVNVPINVVTIRKMMSPVSRRKRDTIRW